MAQIPRSVDTYHASLYETLNPTRPEVSQHDKNVVITGAGSGTGQAVALSFAKADTCNLALLGRRLEALKETKNLIESTKSNTKLHIFSADISSLPSLESAFQSFVTTIGGPIHTPVANAGHHPGFGSLVDLPTDVFANVLHTNAIGTLNTIRAFMPHTPTTTDAGGYRARIIHTTSAATQMEMPSNNAYAISKFTATKLVQAFAAENPDIWVANFHPGMINTAMARDVGSHFDDPDDLDLAGDWTAWAASQGIAAVPSGRYLWAQWDVNEVKALFVKMKNGELKDGETVLGALPIGQRFTIGLTGVPLL